MNRFRLAPLGPALLAALTAGCATGPFSKADSSARSEPLRIESVYRVSGDQFTQDALYRAATADIAGGHYERAIATLRRILQNQADRIDALNAMAVALAQQGRQDEAIAMLEHALTVAPDDSALHNNLGYALMRAGREDQARSYLERARALDPRNQTAAANLGSLATAGQSPASVAGGVGAQPAIARDESGEQPVPVAVDGAPARPGTTAAVETAVAVTAVAVTPIGVTVVASDDASSLVRVSPQVYELRSAVVQHAMAAAETPMPPPLAAGTDRPGSAGQSGKSEPASVSNRARLEVSNGVGITGLARRTADDLQGRGFKTARLTDHRGFGQTGTTVQYRNGYGDEARQLLATLPVPGRLVQVGNDTLRSDIGLRLVLGRDMVPASAVASVESGTGPRNSKI